MNARTRRSLRSCALLCIGLAWQAEAAAVTRPLRGLSLADAVARIAADGVPVVYSSDLVTADLRVETEPQSTDPRGMLEEMLAPHGLALREMASGRLVIVRRPAIPRPQHVTPRATGPPAVAASYPLPEIVVTGSRFQLDRVHELGQIRLAAGDLDRMPDLGDDPMRAVSRLPGTATGGFTARSNIRGGDVDETLVRFDGLRLHNPFHLKDFQALFSTIDPALVRSIDVYTGGYPVALGDRMSGVVDIETLAPPPERVGEMSLSLFSAGALVGDRFDDERGDWLVSARRGNLDLLIDMIDPKRGTPRYFDLHARVGHEVGEHLSVRANLLHFEDDLEISDTDREENSDAHYEDSYYWLAFDWTPNSRLDVHTYLGGASLNSRREGDADQPGVSRGVLHDRRDSDLALIETHWSWRARDVLQWDFGAEYRRASGRYRYDDAVEFDLLFDTPGATTEPLRHRDEALRADGGHVAAYAGARFAVGPNLTADLGLRYDHDDLPAHGDDRLSPRIGLAWQWRDDLAFNVAWGRFAQSQSVEEIQIADGISEYQPSQRADHVLFGVRHRPRPGLELRLDAYEKRYDDLRPRFENLLNSFVILPELKPDRIRIDARSAKAQGLELSVQSRNTEPWRGWAQYAWSRVRDDVDGRWTVRSWDQTHALGAGLGWNDDRWDLTAAVSWRSGWPTTAAELTAEEPIPIVSTGTRNARRLGDFISLDLRAARRFVFDRSLLTVFLELSNATNRDNECCIEYEYDTEEGEPFLELESVRYLPLLPNLGLTWEF